MLKIFSFFLLTLLVTLNTAISDTLKTNQNIFKEPNMKAPIVGEVQKGEVKILEKKGFWIKIKAASIEGWTKMSNVEIQSSKNLDLTSIDSGRSGKNNVVSTSGVRGLDGAELADANPDLKEFEQMKKLSIASVEGEKFSKSSELITRQVKYFETPTTQNNNNSPMGGR